MAGSKGNMSPTFGNSLAHEIKIPDREDTPSPIRALNKSPERTPVRGPEWLIEWKNSEEKRESAPAKPFIKGSGVMKPFSKESTRTDSTRAESTESSNRGFGQFGDKLRLLKSGNPRAKQMAIPREDLKQPLEEDKAQAFPSINPRDATSPFENLQQKRCTSLSAKPKLKSTPLTDNSTEAAVYLTLDQITPLENPDTAWKKCTEDIKCSTNWVKQFESCNIARRLALHHSNTLTATPILLHGFLLELLKLVESLRSSLSKNALLVFADLFTSGKRALDPDLDQIVPVLLKKGTESGSFLGPHAIDALRKMCENCTEGKVITVLLNPLCGFTKAIPQAKLRAVHCLNMLIRKLGEKLVATKEGERILAALANVLSEGAVEIRNAAKEGLALASDEVNNPIEFDRLLQRSLNSTALYKKVSETLAKGCNRSAISEDPPGSDIKKPSPAQSRILSAKRLKFAGKGRGVPAVREKEIVKHIAETPSDLKLESFGVGMKKEVAKPVKKYLPAIEEPKDFDNIPVLAANISSNDWKVKLNSIDALMSIAEKMAEQLHRSAKFMIVLEALVKGLTDSNAKVSLKAVNALERFIPLFKTGIEQNVQLLLTGLSTNLCSTNATLKNKADILIDLLVDTVESVYLAQPFVHIALYGNSRSRPTIILHLCDILPEISKAKPGLITKYVYPASVKLLDDTKAEMKGAVIRLIHTLYKLSGTNYLESVPAAKIERVMSILKV